ncbi:sugar phosphate isomerase/epimerase [Xylanibacillus composti]|uniref:Sugar phosphate isomerase n=1 Tax=Xylanibacillus composti TaxID=1572762 RepID=A0A8J4H4N0_9BACL|nr:TIM barrel protein [Xylanibacillus composti]MDT9726041.1 sugar phosphate isomerase/epimerase [Xylanibacillus composti]GIQ68814.1 sugar phosphate isomerase [Xylanibacillus composti]
MNYMRLKGNLDQANLDNRLHYHPEILEFYLSEQDLKQPELIRERIRQLRELGIKPYLHHPPKFQGKFQDIMSSDAEARAYYRRSSELLAEICREEKAKCVVHAHYTHTESSRTVTKERTRQLREEIRQVLSYARDVFVWEDSTEGLFCYANPYLFEELIVPLELPLNVDVSHTFIGFRGDNAKLREVLEQTQAYATYYHLVDSMGLAHDSLPLGQGKIDWRMVKPLVDGKDFIFEINLGGDHTDCTPMVESARYFERLQVDSVASS